MLDFKDIVKIKNLFQKNENIIQYLKSNTNIDKNEAILHSYDLQAGNYIKSLNNEEHKKQKEKIGIKLASIFKSLNITTLCEAGVGECTTLQHVLSFFDPQLTLGFDISMSALIYGQKYLRSNQMDARLFCAEISNIPLPNNSIDCVYTFHSVANNGDREKIVLTELLRIVKKYLVLIEPDYDLFGEEQRNRMDFHGYTKHLHKHLTDLGVNIIHYQPWELDSNPLNKASIIIVEKVNSIVENCTNEIEYISPISHQVMKRMQEGYHCKEDGFFFPVVKEIPVLIKEKGILINYYDHF